MLDVENAEYWNRMSENLTGIRNIQNPGKTEIPESINGKIKLRESENNDCGVRYLIPTTVFNIFQLNRKFYKPNGFGAERA